MKKAILPLIGAALLVAGIIIGNIIAVLSRPASAGLQSQMMMPGNKLTELVNLIDVAYVDTVDTDSIVEDLMPDVIEQLDPHSSYIPAKDLQAVNEELDGSFSGIGVQFNIQNDTIYVVDVISGGPSERAGMLAGDRIVEVNDTAFVGKDVNIEKVFRKLRGKKGTTVKLGVVRRTSPEMLSFTITRDDVPVNSVDVAYMVTPDIGYVSINKFAATTYEEFRTAVATVMRQGATKLIVDLRGNSGGYLDAAVNMLNEFLSRNDLIVYLQGKSQPYSESRANGVGAFQDMELAVLIDEFSGSASEIFAGAIQDNDRGLIIGRRSFGKGLVQRQFPLGDGSEVRLTVARYYTPSGRCIQKPYTLGGSTDYMEDIERRFLHGEFYSADSIHFPDSLKYKTVGGRIVYGGGGIMPDVFVPRDTTGFSTYYYAMLNKGIPYRFALNYTDANREQLKEYRDWKSLDAYLESCNLYPQLVRFAEKEGVKAKGDEARVSRLLLKNNVHAYIVRNILGDNGFFPLWNRDDVTIQRTVQLLEMGSAAPFTKNREQTH